MNKPLRRPHAPTLLVVGVGLIGGSVAAAAKERGIAGRVLGTGRNLKRLQQAVEAGLIDEAVPDLAEAAGASDMILFCTPVDRIVSGVRQAAPYCRAGTLISDAGSVKASICRSLCAGLPEGVSFVGGHPLAGSEKNGFEFADASLFDKRLCVVTPLPETSTEAVTRLTEFWQRLGSRVLRMSPEEHDAALAVVSHLPHAVAAALARTPSPVERGLAATGFQDTTRIAAGSPEVWTAILLENAEAVIRGIDGFSEHLAEFRQSLVARDAAALKKLLEVAKRDRDGLSSG